MDGIEYEMIKKLPETYKKEVLKIMNFCFKEGKIVKNWKKVQTIFIAKETRKG